MKPTQRLICACGRQRAISNDRGLICGHCDRPCVTKDCSRCRRTGVKK